MRNEDVGVPKTLFRLTKEHEIAVIEMGASHPGDIKTLAETAEPTCGLITNVGRAPRQRPRESFFNASRGPSPLP